MGSKRKDNSTKVVERHVTRVVEGDYSLERVEHNVPLNEKGAIQMVFKRGSKILLEAASQEEMMIKRFDLCRHDTKMLNLLVLQTLMAAGRVVLIVVEEAGKDVFDEEC